MTTKKVYIVEGNRMYYNLFRDVLGMTPVGDVAEADLVCFTGGEDVTPELYNHRKHHSTFCSLERDKNEERIFMYCKNKGVPMVGICRGGQFLNVMNGGTMYQDVGSHGVFEGHLMLDKRQQKEIFVSSTHHQMMRPAVGAEILCTAKEDGHRLWWDEITSKFEFEISTEDIEVVLYPQTKSLCYQPHPEFNSSDYQQMREHFKGLVQELMA